MDELAEWEVVRKKEPKKIEWKDVVILILIVSSLFGTWSVNNIKNVCIDKFKQECMNEPANVDTFYKFKLRLDDQAYVRLHERFEFGLAIISTQDGLIEGTTPEDILNHIESTSAGDCDDRSVYAYLLLENHFPEMRNDTWIHVGILEWETDIEGYNRTHPIIPDHAWMEINGVLEDLAWYDNGTHTPFYRVRLDRDEWAMKYEYYCDNLIRAYGRNMTEHDDFLLTQIDCIDDVYGRSGHTKVNETV